MDSLNIDNKKGYDRFAAFYEEETRLLAPEYYGDYPKDLIMFEKVINQYLKDEFSKDKDWILELGCGTGRLTIPFLKRGYKVVSIDFSQGMVTHTLKKIEEYKDIISTDNFALFYCDIRNIQNDIQKLKNEKNIFVAIAPWSFLHSFSKEDQLKVLRNLSIIMGKGGWLVDFDAYEILLNKDHMQKNSNESKTTKIILSKETGEREKGSVWLDKFYLESDLLPSLIQERQLSVKNEIIFSEKYLMQPPHDYMITLQQVGFQTIAVLNYDIEPFTYYKEIVESAEGVVYICRKVM